MKPQKHHAVAQKFQNLNFRKLLAQKTFSISICLAVALLASENSHAGGVVTRKGSACNAGETEVGQGKNKSGEDVVKCKIDGEARSKPTLNVQKEPSNKNSGATFVGVPQ